MTTQAWTADCQIGERQLLQCVVEVAKAAFRAEASSVFLIEDGTGDFVFEAVAGRGEDHLIGMHLAGDTGIAGWVASTAQPLIADDLDDSSFSRSAAQQTGYVPRTIAAAPLIAEGRVIGVLEVLDRGPDRGELETLELLGLLGAQAAAGIELLQRLRQASIPPDTEDDEAQLLAQVLALADRLTGKAAGRAGHS